MDQSSSIRDKVFYTVNDGNGASNPQSVEVLRELNRRGCTTFILLSVEEVEEVLKLEMLSNMDLVVLLDSSRPNVYGAGQLNADTAPQWAKGEWCVEVTKRLLSPSRVQVIGRQLVHVFGPGQAREFASGALSRKLPRTPKRAVYRPRHNHRRSSLSRW